MNATAPRREQTPASSPASTRKALISTSTIKVAVNGNPAFTWEGDEAEAKKVLEAFPNAARHPGQGCSDFNRRGADADQSAAANMFWLRSRKLSRRSN